MSSDYSSLVNSSNSSLGDIQQQNEESIISSNDEIDKDKLNKQTQISDLKKSAEIGLLPQAEKYGDYGDLGTFGLKQTMDLGSNIRSVGKEARLATPAGKAAAKTARRAALVGPLSGDAPVLIGDDDVGSLGSKVFKAVSNNKTVQRIGQAGSDVIEGSKDVVKGLSSTENIGKSLLKTAEPALSTAGKQLSKLAPAADILSGAINIGSDIYGLEQGKSLSDAMGSNSEERWSNALGIAGSALTFVPGLDIAGGVLDASSAILSYFGEKEDAAAKKKEADLKEQGITSAPPPPQSTPVSRPGLASLGVISNFSKPQDTLISGSGAF